PVWDPNFRALDPSDDGQPLAHACADASFTAAIDRTACFVGNARRANPTMTARACPKRLRMNRATKILSPIGSPLDAKHRFCELKPNDARQEATRVPGAAC